VTRENRNAMIAAAIALAVFGGAAFFMPTIMIALGEVSTTAAALVAAIFVAAPFVALWLRARAQKNRRPD
jgi:membrane protein implicated in regulation of membrane protease activity